MENTIWSLIPPLLAIIMVLLTKRVLISLGAGIVAAAFLMADFNILETLLFIWKSFAGVFAEDGGLNTWNVYILLFLLLLGILTAFISMMGGTRAFGDWMIRKVKTRTAAQLMTMILGMLIFVDDYFNSLTVGPVSKPVTDKHRISRAKLAYIVDSTAAPMSVIAPVSSWGAYIIGIIGTVLVTQNVTEYTGFEAFIKMIPMNFYVWSALGMVLIIAISQADFGQMKVHEDRAIATGEVTNPKKKRAKDTTEYLPESDIGRISDLIAPISALFISTLVAIYWHGFVSIEGEKTLMAILGSADVSFALLCGGIFSLLITFLLFMRHYTKKKLNAGQFRKGIVGGVKSMVAACTILIFAWVISSLIGDLQTGDYLAGIVESSNINIAFLPVIIFIMAGLIAFSTGTSWGAFAILLPIGGQIAGATDISILLPVLAAVLAGAVFGDHCSPISDTTILSSTGASCDHIDHVMTQLPYALVSAGISSVGYIVLGLSGNVWLGLAVVIILLFLVYIGLTAVGSRRKSQINH